ncbi:sigma-54 dependent transcriptional regulator [Proteiniphilum sp.]|uniref:sigma-54-dependent transcriptional regulator n=1 Tax=Proteiniphilum sp. TaxID=1926877 RepID=UPI002B1EE30B|nr:sigma-54 dependent transcriptional regulator [Proteiniphilum sp.]MEA4917179.1 sigma-54 dependent transcriptional regulator [Proteiniphilum sp.]
MNNILIVDDEVKLRTLLSRILTVENFQVVQADNCKSALRALEQTPEIDVVLCDVKMPDGNGVDLTRLIKEKYPHIEVILLTAYGNIPDGVQAMKNGAFDYIIKGDDNNKIIPLLHQAIEKVDKNRKKSITKKFLKAGGADSVIGKSKVIRQSLLWAEKVAGTSTSVLLTGETGTGKEVFAKAIHSMSDRAGKSFVALNCAAFSKELLEGELFGHRVGAFTGASKDQKGLMEEADHGTLFLDEIGEMPLELQPKILRALEAGEFIKIGETKPTKVDIRIIAATNRDLQQEIREGNFREDLYYRISVFQIQLSPLRERREDIPLFIDYFLSKSSGGREISVSDQALKALVDYSWPGNIRELRNVIERSVILMDSDMLQLEDLPFEIQQYTSSSSPTPLSTPGFSIASVEKSHIQKVLRHVGGNKAEAARLLGIGIATLYRKIEEYKLKE